MSIVFEENGVRVHLDNNPAAIEVTGRNRMHPSEAWELIASIESAITHYNRELDGEEG